MQFSLLCNPFRIPLFHLTFQCIKQYHQIHQCFYYTGFVEPKKNWKRKEPGKLKRKKEKEREREEEKGKEKEQKERGQRRTETKTKEEKEKVMSKE